MLFSRIDTEQHLSHILFGNLLGISRSELRQTLMIIAVVVVLVLIKRRDLMLYCFDPAQARVLGLSVARLHYGLLGLLALTIVAALQAVGIILVVAMLIAPGITAQLLCRRFDGLLLTAVCLSVCSCAAGTLISFHIDGATGPCIVLVQASLFGLAQLAVAARQGIRGLIGNR